MARKSLISKEVVDAAIRNNVNVEQILREAMHMPPPPAEWVVKGVHFPEGTMFRCWWKDRPYWGEVKDGALVVADQRFSTPSEATTIFTKPPVNGWRVWEAKFPHTRSWVSIIELRKDKPFAND